MFVCNAEKVNCGAKEATLGVKILTTGLLRQSNGI